MTSLANKLPVGSVPQTCLLRAMHTSVAHVKHLKKLTIKSSVFVLRFSMRVSRQLIIKHNMLKMVRPALRANESGLVAKVIAHVVKTRYVHLTRNFVRA